MSTGGTGRSDARQCPWSAVRQQRMELEVEFGHQTEKNSSRMLTGKEFDLQNMGHLGLFFFPDRKTKFLLSAFSFGFSHINPPFCCPE